MSGKPLEFRRPASKRPPGGGRFWRSDATSLPQRIAEVPALVIATGLPALMMCVAWAIWL